MADSGSFVVRVQSLVGYVFAFIYGACFVFRILKIWIKNPSDRFCKTKKREIPPDVLSNPELGNHSYIQIKNVKLHYVEKGHRSKPLMLCVHGFPEFWYSWRHQLTEFSADYWVVALDMRGYGDSEKPVGSKYYKIQYLVDDLENVIYALGKTQCTLLAHDWGGLVAWCFVLTRPHMVDSYVIMNSTHPATFISTIKSSLDQMKRSWYTFFFQCPYLPELSCRMDDMKFFEVAFKSQKSPTCITEADIEAYKFTFGKPGAFTCPINYYRGNYMLQGLGLEGLGQSDDFPQGLILYGDGDPYLSPQTQEASLQLVKNARLVNINGASHFVQQDDPKAVNNELHKFFTEVKSKKK